MKTVISTSIQCLLIAACLLGSNVHASSIKDELQARLAKATQYYNDNDIDGYMSMYTDDAIHISVRRPMAQGKEAIRKFFAPGMKLFTVESTEEIVDAEQYGDTAHVLFNATLKGAPRGDVKIPPFTEKRVIMVIFKRINSEWLIHRYIASFSPEEKKAK